MTGLQPAGLPHSEIRGSRAACASPRLIAACHVLHRLSVPRHPPCALSNLIPVNFYVSLTGALARLLLLYYHHYVKERCLSDERLLWS